MPARPLRLARLATVLLVISAAGCGDDLTSPTFNPALGIDLALMTQTASGLYYLDVVVGTGATATPNSTATVRYTGWLTNGTQFDTGSYTFRLSAGQAIAGFDEGVRGMKVGSERRIVVPPSLGYGSSGQGPIPPNAHLVFTLELTAVTP
jgi:FKBP-type peptidyl-prolyl cis-trans isomerase